MFSRLDWIKHFIDMHKKDYGPSPDDMIKHNKAFLEVYNDHTLLHRHFYSGHEHLADGTVVAGRTS